MSRVIAVRQGPERRVIRAGMRGRVGPTITGATVAENGHLILTLQDGTEIDAGVIDRPWGTILGDITQQLDLMTQLGLKVNQDTYSTFVAATNNALGDRYTKLESDGRYDAAGTAQQAVADHEAEPDPHPQYTTAAEAAASAPVQSVQGRAGDVVVTKADVGLGSADNTSDMAKPVSTAQAAALALKVNTSDVLDQLESADATKPLSANQGRVLKELINNIQTLLESDNINLDSLQEVVDFIEQNREDLQNLGISNIAGLQAALESKADTNGDYVNLRARATTAADVGLGQVDNTPDASKPISGPQQAALDGKVGTGDSRLTNAREWTASTISQTEAEAGTATTRRAWTAQRVRQAIVAWWNSITSAFGRGFVNSADAAAGRTALELGSAALANVGSGGDEVPDNDAVDAKIAAVVGDVDAALDAINGEVI